MMEFIDDITYANLLAGLTVRSAIARGRIKNITLPDLPDGYFAVTAQDIPGENKLSGNVKGMPYLAEGDVNYAGEPILLLAGPEEEVLHDIAAKILIEYVESQPVLDMVSAEINGCVERIQYSLGDPESAFKNADQIVEGEYTMGSQVHCYPEPQGAVAFWDGTILMVYASSQEPFSIRNELTRLLKLKPGRIRICVPGLGRALEGKRLPSVFIAVHAALLSYAAGKPVKLIYDRYEDFLFTPGSHPALIRHKTALNKDGKPQGMNVDLLLDSGAYQSDSSHVLSQAALAACGAYSCANIEVVAKLVLTNKVPSGFFQGTGRPQAFFAAELHSARLEEISQLDPYIWKKENLLSEGHMTPTGWRLKGHVGAIPVLEEVVRISDFRRKYSAYTAMKNRRKSIQKSQGPLRGIGLSICSQGIGYLGPSIGGDESYSVKVSLNMDKKCRIYTSLIDMGQGLKHIFTHLASKILNLDASKIIIEPMDTQKVPDTGPTTLSQTLHIGAKLVERCCLAIQKKRIIQSLPIEVMRKFKRAKDQNWDPLTFKGNPYESYAWAGTVIDLEIDPVTLKSVCRGIWMALDAGVLWNEEWAKEIAESGFIQALGYASRQSRGPDEDVTKHPLLTGFNMHELLNMPAIKINFINPNDIQHSEDTKAFDELPFMGVAPAYTAAVSQATGLYINRMPLTPEVIQECLATE